MVSMLVGFEVGCTLVEGSELFVEIVLSSPLLLSEIVEVEYTFFDESRLFDFDK